jgi:hypothetical protein
MRKAFIIIFLIIITKLCFSQAPVIRNVFLYYKDQKVIVNYDLKDFKSSNKHHSVQLLFVDDQFNVRLPDKLTGDFGDSIVAGTNKQIEWAIFEDDVNISQELRPVLLADGLKKGGANNLLLSLFIPGLGDYFVENPRNMVFKPYLRTFASLSCITLGYLADKNRVDLVFKEWSTSQKRVVGWDNVTDYWLFKFDKEIFYFTGISIWLMDVIWVYAKGKQNEKLKIFSNYSPALSYNDGITNFGFTFTFN